MDVVVKSLRFSPDLKIIGGCEGKHDCVPTISDDHSMMNEYIFL